MVVVRQSRSMNKIECTETHHVQNCDFDQTLIIVSRLVLYNLHRQELASLEIQTLDNLPKCAVAEDVHDLVLATFTFSDNVANVADKVPLVVVKAIVVGGF